MADRTGASPEDGFLRVARALALATGEGLPTDSVRRRNLLLDVCGSDYRPLLELLLSTESLLRPRLSALVGAGAPANPVSDATSRMRWETSRAPMVHLVVATRYLQPDVARWAVDSWGAALGVISYDLLLPPTVQSAHQPAAPSDLSGSQVVVAPSGPQHAQGAWAARGTRQAPIVAAGGRQAPPRAGQSSNSRYRNAPLAQGRVTRAPVLPNAPSWAGGRRGHRVGSLKGLAWTAAGGARPFSLTPLERFAVAAFTGIILMLSFGLSTVLQRRNAMLAERPPYLGAFRTSADAVGADGTRPNVAPEGSSIDAANAAGVDGTRADGPYGGSSVSGNGTSVGAARSASNAALRATTPEDASSRAPGGRASAIAIASASSLADGASDTLTELSAVAAIAAAANARSAMAPVIAARDSLAPATIAVNGSRVLSAGASDANMDREMQQGTEISLASVRATLARGVNGSYRVDQRVRSVDGSESCAQVASALAGTRTTTERIEHRKGATALSLASRNAPGVLHEDARFDIGPMQGVTDGVRWAFRMTGRFTPEGFTAVSQTSTYAVIRWGRTQSCITIAELVGHRVSP